MQGLFFDGTLKLRHDLPVPERTSGDALIKVLMTGICQTDIEITKGYMGFRGILGHEFVGLVQESDNPELRGRRVVGEINCGCGVCSRCLKGMSNHCTQRTVLGIAGKAGAFAEYLTLPDKNLHLVPDTVSNEEAVFVEPLAACFRILEQVTVHRDHTAAVLGDGRIGLLCAQVLKTIPCRVSLIGKHPEKLSLAEGMGILTRMVNAAAGSLFDLVVDCTGSPSGLPLALELVKPRGTIVIKSTTASHQPIDINPVVINEICVLGSRCGPFAPAVRALQEKTVSVAPLISGIFPFSNALEAFRTASQKGTIKVLVTIDF